MMNKSISEKIISGEIQISPFSDKILYDDNDGDGIANKWDAEPDEPIDTNFLYVDNIDKYTIDDLFHIDYKKNEERGNEIYNTLEDKGIGILTEKVLYAFAIAAHTDLSGIAVEGLFNNKLSYGRTPNGADSLIHYLNNSGKDYKLNSKVALGVVKNQRRKYYDQINSLLELAEKTLIPGKEYSFITTNNTNQKIWFVNFHLEQSVGGVPLSDWWLAVGGGRNGVKTTISCYLDESGNMNYIANIEYFLYDFYDWNEKDEESLANLHKYGIAKYFRQYGSFSFNLNWTKGSRYPASSHDDRYNMLDIVEFEGIDDQSMLSNCYENAKNFYIGIV